MVLGHGGFWPKTPGPLITSINKLLTYGNSANGIELWFGCSSEVDDGGWLSVHAEELCCSSGGFENRGFQLCSLHPRLEAQLWPIPLTPHALHLTVFLLSNTDSGRDCKRSRFMDGDVKEMPRT